MGNIFIENIQVINLINYVVVGINFILAAIILSRGWRQILNVLFGALALSVSLWAFSVVGFFSRDLLDINWVLYTHTFALFVSVFFLYFSIYYPQKINIPKKYLSLPIIPVIFLILLIFFTDFVIGGTDGITYEISSGYLFYSLIIMGYFFTTYFILFKQYKKTGNIQHKNQIKYLFIGYTLSSLFASFTNLTLPYFGVFNFTWAGPFFTLILVASIFISIVKFGLFNIRVIVAELFSVLIIFALLFDILISENTAQVVIKSIILVIIAVFIYSFIKGVYKEVHAREKLAIVNKKLERLNMEKSEFLSFASHEVKHPLTNIKNALSLVLEGSFGDINEKLKELLQRVYGEVENSVVIIDNYLNISRIEQGRMNYEFEPLDMKKLTHTVVDGLKHKADEKGNSITLQIPEEVDISIKADYGKIKEVLTNIIDNSIKYTQKGGCISITLSKDDALKKIRFTVKDNGIGMSKQTIAKLFRRFSRATGIASQAKETSGTGLGMYISREIVLGHGGRVWAESGGEGRGSTFILELPYEPKKEEDHMEDVDENKQETP